MAGALRRPPETGAYVATIRPLRLRLACKVGGNCRDSAVTPTQQEGKSGAALSSSRQRSRAASEALTTAVIVNEKPLVSIGVPVRNGSRGLRRALSSLVDQTYPNLEIIISDNCSDDDTESICRGFADRDSRITYCRQASPLTATVNFRFVFERSHGKYFMWAAHDDWRSPNYVEVLLRGFEREPGASIVFSDASYSRSPDLLVREPLETGWESVGLSFWGKLKNQASHVTVHVYGLINPQYLHGYPWYPIFDSPDVPLLHWLLCQGDFVYEGGAHFVYFNPGKTRAQSILEIANNASVDLDDGLAPERLAWVAATAVRAAEYKMGRRRNRMAVFLAVHVWRSHGLKNAVYRWTPAPLRSLWRVTKTAFVRRRKSTVA